MSLLADFKALLEYRRMLTRFCPATPPEVNYPAPADELANQPRRTKQSELEAEPFLQSISA